MLRWRLSSVDGCCRMYHRIGHTADSVVTRFISDGRRASVIGGGKHSASVVIGVSNRLSRRVDGGRRGKAQWLT